MKTQNPAELFGNYFSAADRPELVHVGPATYISIYGEGSPGTNAFYQKKKAVKEFARALESLFTGTSEAYTNDVVEIFYWYDENLGPVDIAGFYTTYDLDLLQYRIAIRVPDYISEEHILMARSRLKGGAYTEETVLFRYDAGQSVQVMHHGPFAEELETLDQLQRFATKSALSKSGMHIEIHLDNFEKGQSQQHLRTILRDPVSKI